METTGNAAQTAQRGVQNHRVPLKPTIPHFMHKLKIGLSNACFWVLKGLPIVTTNESKKVIIVPKSDKFGVFPSLNYHLYIIKMIGLGLNVCLFM
jgi:hypothetical protein